jgi:hypothetical protein
MGISKRIKPSLTFITRASDAEFRGRAGAIYEKIYNSPEYPNPPVTREELKAALDRYDHTCAAALDGGKRAIVERDAQRTVLGLMLRRLGNYVDIACENEMSKLIASGFEPVSTTFSPAEPPPRPRIKKIKHGPTSGTLLVSMSSHYRKVVQYKLRHGEGEFHDIQDSWTETIVASARPATLVSGLTPGRVYTFQVCAFGHDNTYSDWSDAVSLMCI